MTSVASLHRFLLFLPKKFNAKFFAQFIADRNSVYFEWYDSLTGM